MHGYDVTSRRRAFPSWSVELPVTFDETVVEEGAGYWHAWDATRSISLTSVQLAEAGKRVPATEIVRHMGAILGHLEEIERLPPGLIGRIGSGPAEPGARAARLLSGILAVDGCVLVVTITADDPEWASRMLESIQNHRPGH